MQQDRWLTVLMLRKISQSQKNIRSMVFYEIEQAKLIFTDRGQIGVPFKDVVSGKGQGGASGMLKTFWIFLVRSHSVCKNSLNNLRWIYFIVATSQIKSNKIKLLVALCNSWASINKRLSSSRFSGNNWWIPGFKPPRGWAGALLNLELELAVAEACCLSPKRASTRLPYSSCTNIHHRALSTVMLSFFCHTGKNIRVGWMTGFKVHIFLFVVFSSLSSIKIMKFYSHVVWYCRIL